MTDQGTAIKQQAPSRAGREPLWSLDFVRICASQFLSYANQVMLSPVLPIYLATLGLTASFVGISVLAFSVTSFVTRPFVGQGVDRWKAVGVFVLGALALGIASLAYLIPSLASPDSGRAADEAARLSYLVPAMAVFLLARALHGTGWAAINTAGSTIASESTPASRRGQGLGYFNMTRSLAHAVGPAVAFWVMAVSGFPAVLILSACLAFAGAGVAGMIRERPRARHTAPKSSFWRSLIERQALFASLLHLLITTSHPITTVYVALYAQHRGIGDLTAFFVAYGSAGIAAQFFAHLSDRWGRAPLTALGFATCIGGLVIMMLADSLLPLTIGGLIYSAGSNLAAPAMMALAIDMTAPGSRGAAMATYTLSFQIGTGFASLAWGFLIDWVGYEAMFLAAISVLSFGLAIVGLNWRRAGGMPVRAA